MAVWRIQAGVHGAYQSIICIRMLLLVPLSSVGIMPPETKAATRILKRGSSRGEEAAEERKQQRRGSSRGEEAAPREERRD
jgi:hypothetical protein